MNLAEVLIQISTGSAVAKLAIITRQSLSPAIIIVGAEVVSQFSEYSIF